MRALHRLLSDLRRDYERPRQLVTREIRPLSRAWEGQDFSYLHRFRETLA